MEGRSPDPWSFAEPDERSDGAVVRQAGKARGSAEPVLFWAERDPGLAWRGWSLLTALTLPAGLLVPDAVLLGAALAALVTWLNLKAFRLEVTPRALRFRPGLLAATRSWPLAELGSLEARDDSMRPLRWGCERPSVGHVLIELPDGLLGLSGLKDPQELVEAVEAVRRGTCRPP
jgi:hypothetical protein